MNRGAEVLRSVDGAAGLSPKRERDQYEREQDESHHGRSDASAATENGRERRRRGALSGRPQHRRRVAGYE